MGRLLGAHESDPLDRPDLNKCPDCGCFFAQEKCPLCGKVCPEEFRAGNRKPVKPKKQKRGGSDRVVFVEWYHSWWFIILMMFVMPVVGIILLATSPHKKSLKITFAVIAIIYCLLPFILHFAAVGIFGMLSQALSQADPPPVDTSLTREEYINVCNEVSAEEFYRSPDKYKGEYISMELLVIEKISDGVAYLTENEEATYYLCRSTDGGNWTILVRDYQQGGIQNFIGGDIVTVYGEGAGNVRAYDAKYILHEEPCINMAYADIHK